MGDIFQFLVSKVREDGKFCVCDLLQRCRTPEPQKVLPAVLGEVPARGGCAREGAREGAWEGVRDLFLVLRQEDEHPPEHPPKHLLEHLPEHPTSGPALPQAPPGALLGVRGYGTSVSGEAHT